MSRFRTAILSLPLVIAAPLVAAQETDIKDQISVELNAAETTEDACKLTFMITNGLETPVDKIIYEAVLFDTEGQVDRLTLFDFGTLPAARPRVRQFVVPDLACEALGRVLFNGAETCTGAGLAEGACEDGLLLSSRTAVELLG